MIITLTVHKYERQIFFAISQQGLKKLIKMIVENFNFLPPCETPLIITINKPLIITIIRRVHLFALLNGVAPHLINITHSPRDKIPIQLLYSHLFFRWLVPAPAKLDLLLSQLRLQFPNTFLQINVLLL